MSQFEFFMGFYGLMLGLAVAELFSGFARIVQERAPPRIGVIVPMLGAIVLIEITATFIDAWRTLQGVSIQLDDLAFPTVAAVTYFGLAVILVPRQFQDWPDLDGYFDKRRRWIAGLLLLANLILMALSFAATTYIQNSDWLGLTGWALRQVWLLTSYVVLFFSRRRWLDIAAATSAVLFYVFAYAVRPLLWGA